MKTSRRNFLKQSSLVVPAILLTETDTDSGIAGYTYPLIEKLSDAVMQDGWLRVRLELSSDSPKSIGHYSEKIAIKGAKVSEISTWFFEGEDYFNPDTQEWQGTAALRSVDVLVVKLKGADEDTEIRLKHPEGDWKVSLGELAGPKTLAHSWGETQVQANLLLDFEIGHLELDEMGIPDPGKNFSFVIMADPQGGDPAEPTVRVPTRMKIHNAFIEESIRVVNELSPSPAFTIVNGDIVDSEGQERNFAAMLTFFKELKTPLLFEVGNHETRYRSVFTPGYNMSAFANFFAAQKAVNGLEKLLYSFEIGEWHILVFPDPLRNHFWETHPHYFEWLEQDLETYRDWPTICIHHVPLHPIGIDPLTSYVESPYVKRTILDILSKWGNVKYVFSGHVHIPLKASLKTAVEYKGMKLINLPAAGFRPRGFGEADFDGGPTQGVAILSIQGKEARVSFKTVTDTVFEYPDSFPEFRPEDWSLWLNHKWELPANPELINGSFEAGMEGWHRRFVYEEDERPANACEVERLGEVGHFHALYLFSRERRYNAPGQDRMPQTINQVCQAVAIPSNQSARLHVAYRLDVAHFHPDAESAAFVWVEGYHNSHKRLNLVYSHGKMIPAPGSRYSHPEQAPYVHFDLPGDRDKWNEVELNIWEDSGLELPIDRLVINLGVWTSNEEGKNEIGVFFDNLSIQFLDPVKPQASSRLGQQVIPVKPEQLLWKKRNRHIAGEHRYIEIE